MEPKTLTALEGSIRKWDCICQGISVDHGTENCPLCALFWVSQCNGCVVTPYCDNMEYHDWWVNSEGRNNNAPIPASSGYLQDAALAEAELIYLLKLLPDGHSWREMI